LVAVLLVLVLALGIVAFRHPKKARRVLRRLWPSRAPLADGDMLELEMRHPDGEVDAPTLEQRVANDKSGGKSLPNVLSTSILLRMTCHKQQ